MAVELSRMDTSLLKERALTENVSSRGMRVATERECKPRDPAAGHLHAGRRLVPSAGSLL